MMTWLTRLALAALALPFAFSNAKASIDVDVELVIAVDVSSSMDLEEYRFQRQGYVEAIRHPEFIRAISHLLRRRIAVTYVEWSSASFQKVIVPWREIDGPAGAEAFATALEAAPLLSGSTTSISAVLAFAQGLLLSNRFEGDRRVIDVSGDGPHDGGTSVAAARDAAVAKGIVVNGLPIIIDPSIRAVDLARYYSDCVIGGPGSFMLPARGMEEFAEAVRQKLIREVAGLREAMVVPINVPPPTDCLAYEKMRPSYRRRLAVEGIPDYYGDRELARDRGLLRERLKKFLFQDH